MFVCGDNPNRRGLESELAIELEATRCGVSVFRPTASADTTDLIFDVGGKLLRVQCKSATRAGSVLKISLRRSRNQSGGRRVYGTYSATEVDLLAAYCADLDRCFLLPAALIDGKTSVFLRLEAALNGQTNGVHLASDFALPAVIAELEQSRKSGHQAPPLAA